MKKLKIKKNIKVDFVKGNKSIFKPFKIKKEYEDKPFIFDIDYVGNTNHVKKPCILDVAFGSYNEKPLIRISESQYWAMRWKIFLFEYDNFIIIPEYRTARNIKYRLTCFIDTTMEEIEILKKEGVIK